MPPALYDPYSALLRYQVRFHSWFTMLTSEYALGDAGRLRRAAPAARAAALGAVRYAPAAPDSRRPPARRRPRRPSRRPRRPAAGAAVLVPAAPAQQGDADATPPDAGAAATDRRRPEWPPPQPPPTPGSPPGAMPPPSPWERTSTAVRRWTRCPRWGILDPAGCGPVLDDLRHRLGLDRVRRARTSSGTHAGSNRHTTPGQVNTVTGATPSGHVSAPGGCRSLTADQTPERPAAHTVRHGSKRHHRRSDRPSRSSWRRARPPRRGVGLLLVRGPGHRGAAAVGLRPPDGWSAWPVPRRALDIETGGGEVLATVARPPALLVATEGWRPNVAVARDAAAPARGRVVAVADAPTLPFADGVVRPRGEPPSRRRPVGGDRPGAATGRDVPVAADRAGHEPRADRLHDGPPAGQRAPQPERARRGRSGRTRGGRPAGVRPAGGVLRRRRGRVLPAQGALDGAGLHARGLRRRAAPPARADRAGGLVRLHGATAPRRGARRPG